MADIELSHVNMSIMLLQKRMTGALVTTVRFMRKKNNCPFLSADAMI